MGPPDEADHMWLPLHAIKEKGKDCGLPAAIFRPGLVFVLA